MTNIDANFVIINKTTFPTKVAITEQEQMRGLMNEPFPPPVMTFVYASSRLNKFWMSNTISPLDIVFCNNNKIINICQGIPLSTRLIGNNELSDLVIEFPAGTCKAYDLKVGDLIKTNFSQVSLQKISKLKY